MTIPESETHTNRELELMLAGRKPLAMFYEEISLLPDEAIIPEEKFAPYVANGELVRKEVVIDGPYSAKLDRKTNIKYVLFAKKDEEWRINSMILLHHQHSKTNEWNETCERIEGALLGYSEEEIDSWCNERFSKSAL